MAADLMILRRLRDTHLMPNAPGRRIAEAYYRLSPSVAALVANSDFARGAARQLLRPLIWSAAIALETTAGEKGTMLALCFTLSAFLVPRYRRSMRRRSSR